VKANIRDKYSLFDWFHNVEHLRLQVVPLQLVCLLPVFKLLSSLVVLVIVTIKKKITAHVGEFLIPAVLF
jgi:hypothetical protein